MSDNKTKKKKSARRRKDERKMILHMAMIVGVILIVAFTVYGVVRLTIWDKGKESDYDRNEINHDFDVETEDYLLPLSPDVAELQVDDGVNSILLLGNGSIANTKGDPKGFAAMLEDYTGGRVYDATINHSYLSIKNFPFDEKYPTDLFSLYWICQCISINDFSPLKGHAATWDGDPDIVETVDMLEEIDMSTIDTVVILYDYHDYESGRELENLLDATLPLSCGGSLGNSIKALHESHPQMRIIVGSPYFCYVENKDGVLESGETADFGYGPLGDYMVAYKNAAVTNEASFIDNYFGSITVDNYEKYLDGEHKRLNDAGLKLMAQRTASFIGMKK